MARASWESKGVSLVAGPGSLKAGQGQLGSRCTPGSAGQTHEAAPQHLALGLVAVTRAGASSCTAKWAT